MKKSFFLSAILTITTIASISSCTNGDDKVNDTGINASKDKYYCPMKCEGEKTYTEEGNCPECGMNLIKD